MCKRIWFLKHHAHYNFFMFSFPGQPPQKAFPDVSRTGQLIRAALFFLLLCSKLITVQL